VCVCVCVRVRVRVRVRVCVYGQEDNTKTATYCIQSVNLLERS